FREGVVAFEQVSPLGELHVRWTGSDEGEIEVADEFDGRPEPPAGEGDQPDADETGGDEGGAESDANDDRTEGPDGDEVTTDEEPA
ncbi:MAG: segregation/condensation protein A, partial [Nocardioidaceae bacterium]